VTPAALVSALLTAVGQAPPRVTTEMELHDYLEPRLRALGRVSREYTFGPSERVDFLVDGGGWRLAVEVKIKGSASAVERQLSRYARQSGVTGVVLVTTRSTHIMPPDIEGVPVAVACLSPYLGFA
jgi:hypothetical protein